MFHTSSHPLRLPRFRSFEERLGIVGFTLMLLFAVSQGAFAHDFKVGSLVIDHPWSRAVPEGGKVAGGYMTIRNEGSDDDRLIEIRSGIAGKAEIHEMKVDDKGVMTMRPLADGIEVPAGGEVALAPGGQHVMFMQLSERPAVGERFAATLVFEKAGEVEVEFAVEAMGGGKPDHGSHDGH
ncbi:MAG: copper chaperone PCu(A)C [Rhizobiaceae bacterium]|nr:copper chaperone PCu(A)C [Rhizobiaceae bacterium]MCV0407893.1 copper chaperone PCu(A)C [Rhizobiaceae bacterium]